MRTRTLCGVVVVAVAALGAVPPAGAKTNPKTTTTTSAPPAPTTTTAVPVPDVPAPVAPGGTVAWQAAGRSVLGRQLLFLSSAFGAQLAWMPPGLVRGYVVPGTGDPMVSVWGGQVAPEARPFLIAGFNGGFKTGDFVGGILAFGQQFRSQAAGVASFVVYDDGSITVGEWGRQIDTTRKIVAVRQNLGMLVDGGQPTAASASPGNWGGSVAGVATARSAVGVDANGGLVWAGGRVSPNDLARALVAGGAVRGMQLDINPDWVNFNVYAPGADNVVHGQPVYGATSADRYLTPNSRDFIVIAIRGTIVPGGTAKLGQAALATEVTAK
jgi:hypothetical protein